MDMGLKQAKRQSSDSTCFEALQQLQACIKSSCLQEHHQQQLVHTITVWEKTLEHFYISWELL